MKSCSSPKMIMMMKFVTAGLILTLLITSVAAKGAFCHLDNCPPGSHRVGDRPLVDGGGSSSASIDGSNMGLTMTCFLSCVFVYAVPKILNFWESEEQTKIVWLFSQNILNYFRVCYFAYKSRYHSYFIKRFIFLLLLTLLNILIRVANSAKQKNIFFFLCVRLMRFWLGILILICLIDIS